MKTLVVCGDSYMSPVVGKHAGTHFSELIAKELNYELIAYSRGGMSNGGICIQIDTAINLNPKPDLILVGTTSYNRIEWPINQDPIEKFTVQDLVYNDHKSFLSSSYTWLNKTPKLVSTILSDIWERYKKSAYYEIDPLIEHRVRALYRYFELLYHPSWKREQDKLMLYAILHKLHVSKIPYVICFEGIKNYAKEFEWLNYGNSLNYFYTQFNEILACSNVTAETDPGYHTTPECQQKIADKLLRNVKEIITNSQM
jgi:hypothetical protein